ncbi:MAG: YceI family protein [bacterium]
MQRIAKLLALAALAAAWALPGSAATYDVDASHSHIGFRVRHILTKVSGQFKEVSGTFTFDPKSPDTAGGTFTAKAASIDTNAAKRDAHLRSEDFLWAEKYPDLTLVVKKLKATGKGRYQAAGDLTIRGVTKPVVLDVVHNGTDKSPWGQIVAGFEARVTIKRKEFGLMWNKVLETGALFVGDDVELILDVEGVEKAGK